MKNCIFCKIIKGELPSEKIYENSFALAILDINPVRPGHTLIVPKKHFENIYSTPDKTMAQISIMLKKISVAIKKGLKAEGVNISMNNERAAGQVIFHTHFHIIPRISNDGLKLWPQKKYEENKIKIIAQKIRNKIK